MIKMVTKQNIIHWHMSGMSQRSIARQAKVSRRTVQKVLRESESIRQKGNDDAPVKSYVLCRYSAKYSKLKTMLIPSR